MQMGQNSASEANLRRNVVGLCMKLIAQEDIAWRREVHLATLPESYNGSKWRATGILQCFSFCGFCHMPGGRTSVFFCWSVTRQFFQRRLLSGGHVLAPNCLIHACTKVTDSLQGAGASQGIRKWNRKETERRKVTSNLWGGVELCYCSGISTEDLLAGSPNCCR